jgi:NTP pyrophosphatase (non-canonical NTP hydrolase)
MTLNELRDKIYKNALAKGFYRDYLDILSYIDKAHKDEGSYVASAAMDRFKHIAFAQRIALIQSEASEALEADRTHRHADLISMQEQMQAHGFRTEDFQRYIKDTVEDEIADTIIRLLDLCGMLDIDIDKHIQLKMQYNSSRPYLHGKEY